MTVVGFVFTKMNAEKKENTKGKINIANNVSIKDVKEGEVAFGNDSQKSLNFTFLFTSKYEPAIGEITLEGNVIYMDTKDNTKKIVAGWKKEKQIDKEIMKGILNTVLTKCNIQALILSKEINLPPPIPLPKVDSKK